MVSGAFVYAHTHTRVKCEKELVCWNGHLQSDSEWLQKWAKSASSRAHCNTTDL